MRKCNEGLHNIVSSFIAIAIKGVYVTFSLFRIHYKYICIIESFITFKLYYSRAILCSIIN